MVDADTRAACAFFRAVSDLVQNAPPWDGRVIRHDITPDEVRDITLISQRVYGRRDEFLAVMAAAGIDRVDQVVRQKTITLPTPAVLYAIKRLVGFESEAPYRQDFSPIWRRGTP